MDTIIGLGISIKLDSYIAGKEAAKNAFDRLGKYSPNIIIAFISPIFNHSEAIRGIRSITNETPLTGCSTIASITSLGVSRNSVTVCAISSDSINFSCDIGKDIRKNSRIAGNTVAGKLLKVSGSTRQAYLMFSDCLSGNMADVLRGAQEILGTSFPMIGGSGIDNFAFKTTYQYLNDTVYTDSCVGILISGNIKIGIGKAHGWQPIGRSHKITKAKSNIIKEIDRKKAVELYEESLGKPYNELMRDGIAKLGISYPLGIYVNKEEEYLTRSPLSIRDMGGLMVNAEVPEGEDMHLMIGDRNNALEATRKACLEALKRIRSKPKFAIVFSDIGRFQLLLKDLRSELEVIKEAIGRNVPFFGCYTCGEYAPIGPEEYKGQSFLHNQTISVTVFAE